MCCQRKHAWYTSRPVCAVFQQRPCASHPPNLSVCDRMIPSTFFFATRLAEPRRACNLAVFSVFAIGANRGHPRGKPRARGSGIHSVDRLRLCTSLPESTLDGLNKIPRSGQGPGFRTFMGCKVFGVEGGIGAEYPSPKKG